MHTFRNKYIDAFNSFFGIGLPSHADCPMDKLLSSNFPKHIECSEGKVLQEYLNFVVEPPAHTPEECIANGVTYEANCSIQIRQTNYNKDGDATGKEKISLPLSPIQLVNQNGDFIISGKIHDLRTQLKKRIGVSVPDENNISIKDMYGNKISFKRKQNSTISIKINGQTINCITVLRYLNSLGNRTWKGTSQELIESLAMAQVVKIDRKKLNRHIYRSLAYPVYLTWLEEYVDENTGDIYSEHRSEELLEQGTYIDKGVIDLLVSSKRMCDKKVYIKFDDCIESPLLQSLYKDPTSNKQEAFIYIYRRVFGKDPVGGWKNKAARKALNSVLLPEIGLIGRASINQILGYGNDVKYNADTEDCSVLAMGSEFLTKKDYIDVLKTLSYSFSIYEEKGRDLTIPERERAKSIDDYQRVFSTFVSKEICRFEFTLDRHKTKNTTYPELTNTTRPFSIAESLFYTHLPLVYVTDIDITVCKPDGYAVYNFSGEKFVRLTGVKFEIESIEFKEGVQAICNNSLEKFCALGCAPFSGLSIKHVEFPDSLVEIGKNAFCGCGIENELTFPTSLRYIHSQAFVRSCLKKVTIPKNLNMAMDAFQEAYIQDTMEVDPDNPYFANEDLTDKLDLIPHDYS